MASLSTTPTYPVPNKEVRIAIALTESGTNYVRIWVTVAPEGSELATKITESTQSRFEVFDGDGGAAQPWRFTPDVGGKYTFLAQEYTKGNGFGGGYEGDPLGAKTETKVGGEATLTLEIGQAVQQPIGVGADVATLVFWVWAGTIRKTTIALHGENSPRIESDSPSPLAKSAMETSAVKTALAALVDIACNPTATGTLATIVAEMVTDLNAHNAALGGVHSGADGDNVIPPELQSAPTPQTLIEFVNDALPKMRRHRLNDHGGETVTPAPGGTGSAAYHVVGTAKADLLNMPLYTSVGSHAEAYAALADIWRAHEGHRVSTVVHGTADTTNALAALPPLLEVHRQYLTVLANPAPAAPPAQSSGVQHLISVAGFEVR